MNKIYRKVWNRALGAMVVASELASARGKAGAGALFGAIAMGAMLSLTTVGAVHAQSYGDSCYTLNYGY